MQLTITPPQNYILKFSKNKSNFYFYTFAGITVPTLEIDRAQ